MTDEIPHEILSSNAIFKHIRSEGRHIRNKVKDLMSGLLSNSYSELGELFETGS